VVERTGAAGAAGAARGELAAVWPAVRDGGVPPPPSPRQVAGLGELFRAAARWVDARGGWGGHLPERAAVLSVLALLCRARPVIAFPGLVAVVDPKALSVRPFAGARGGGSVGPRPAAPRAARDRVPRPTSRGRPEGPCRRGDVNVLVVWSPDPRSRPGRGDACAPSSPVSGRRPAARYALSEPFRPDGPRRGAIGRSRPAPGPPPCPLGRPPARPRGRAGRWRKGSAGGSERAAHSVAVYSAHTRPERERSWRSSPSVSRRTRSP
jgi:hypothetical protein